MGLVVILVATSCDKLSEEVTNISFDRLFRPIKFNVTNIKTQETFTWAAVDSAVSYTLQVSLDSLDYSVPVLDTTLTTLTYSQEFAGSTKFFARIRANSNAIVKDSKFNSTLAFKTPSENLFEGFGTKNNTGNIYSAYMNNAYSLDIRWSPGANVTHLILTSGDKKDSVLITGVEAAAGVKIVSSLSNSKWAVRLFNNKVLRGITTGTVEGDVVLSSGGDLPLALANAVDGQVILLPVGATFPMGISTYRLGKNIKVRGLSTTNRPVICPSTGSSTTASVFGFVDASIVNYVKFENVDFTGYSGNNVAGTKVGYLFNNNTNTTVKSLSFVNCSLHNFGNTPMRVQGSKNQVIDTLAFNGCVINDIGFASTYAIVNSNSADFINTINFSNCTVSNFKGSLVSRTTQTLNSINITNCTFNQGMLDPSTVRFFIDTNSATFTGSGITIKNCIFGSSGGTLGAAGIRTTSAISISGSYYTTDYVDQTLVSVVDYSKKSLMTSYTKLSTELWNSPTTGDFTFKDFTFKGKGVAGDLRWQ